MKIDSASISYLDDDDTVVYAHVDLLEISLYYVKIKTKKNILTIPMNRILKIKQQEEDKNDGS